MNKTLLIQEYHFRDKVLPAVKSFYKITINCGTAMRVSGKCAKRELIAPYMDC